MENRLIEKSLGTLRTIQSTIEDVRDRLGASRSDDSSKNLIELLLKVEHKCQLLEVRHRKIRVITWAPLLGGTCITRNHANWRYGMREAHGGLVASAF